MLLREAAGFELAREIRSEIGAPLGKVFSFLSGLYFRGKLAYANHFASDAFVITTNRGLLPVSTFVNAGALRAMGTDDIDPANATYRNALSESVAKLSAQNPDAEVVLLGSVATGKYVDILIEHLGERLMFPKEFIGRGDMSRGGLMLRCVAENRELDYIPVRGAVRNGERPAKLAPRRWTAA